jgi:signal transduction histidine kinase
MIDLLNKVLAGGPFIPHGHCYLWLPALVWLHVGTDSLIALAYYVMPIILISFVRKRPDLPFNWMFFMFGAFIIACGTTHVMSVWNLWYPTYWLAGGIKAGTAAVSLATASLLVPLVPKALALPSPAQLEVLNRQLQEQIREREHAEVALRRANDELEKRVQERTTALRGANEVLRTEVIERNRAEQRLLAQHTVTQMLAEAATLEDVTPNILQAVCECLLWDLGALWSVDRQAGVLRCVEVWHKASVEVPHFDAISRASKFLSGIELPGRVWSSRAAAYIPDVVQDANFPRASIAAREGLHAAFGVPILVGGDVLGVMEFFSHEIRQPDQDLLTIMATIGSQIGQFTERKRAEEALHQAQAELAHVTRVATLGELAASIAHEINQPLGAVVNNASACVRWLAAQNLEEARQSAALVIADGHRAGEIIGRIRALAKKAPPQKDWVDLNATIRDVIALARSEVQRNGVAVETHLSDDVPLILADRIQVQQVLLNLLMNAIEAMSGVSTGPRALWVSSERVAATEVLIAVRDSGPGFDPQHIDRLFAAFYTTKPHGLGMGLAISRSIVAAHGGRLWATANTPHGAIFQFTVPMGREGVA